MVRTRTKRSRGGGRVRPEYENKVVEIKRVTRVVAGGKRMRFRALVVVGNRKGKVGVGLKKGADVADAIGKAIAAAKKNMISIKITAEGSIPHGIEQKYKGAKVILKPAREGTGIIAGGPVRAVLDLVGIRNISSKMLGSANKASNVKAVFAALKKMKRFAKKEKIREGEKSEEQEG